MWCVKCVNTLYKYRHTNVMVGKSATLCVNRRCCQISIDQSRYANCSSFRGLADWQSQITSIEKTHPAAFYCSERIRLDDTVTSIYMFTQFLHTKWRTHLESFRGRRRANVYFLNGIQTRDTSILVVIVAAMSQLNLSVLWTTKLAKEYHISSE